MSYSNIMKQLSDGKKIIKLDAVPDSLFLDAIKVRDVCIIKIRGRKESAKFKHGSPDVLARSITGETATLSRDMLAHNFRHLSGKKITVACLRYNKGYRVQCNDNSMYKILLLPANVKGVIRGKTVGPNKYIVCKVNETGEIVRESMTAIRLDHFKKMFKVPMQDVIKRNIGKGGGQESKFLRRKGDRKPVVLEKRPVVAAVIEEKTIPNVIVNNEKRANNSTINRPINRETIETKEVSKYKYEVTHRIVDLSGNNIGFVVMDIATKQRKPLDYNKVLMLCESKLVSNLMAVTKENSTNNTKFLKGNGITIDNLPKILA
jgi:hypothetical protein